MEEFVNEGITENGLLSSIRTNLQHKIQVATSNTTKRRSINMSPAGPIKIEPDLYK
jgi:hypothetical protein